MLREAETKYLGYKEDKIKFVLSRTYSFKATGKMNCKKEGGENCLKLKMDFKTKD